MKTFKKSLYEARFGLLGICIPIIITPLIATVTWEFWVGGGCVVLFIFLMGYAAVKYDQYH